MGYSKAPTATVFDQEQLDKPIIVMGNSYSLKMPDLKLLERFIIIGCNRGLKDAAIYPDYLLINDREPYMQERDDGRLKDAAKSGIKLLLGRGMFDTKVRCQRFDDQPEIPTQPLPVDFSYATFDVCHKCPTNITTFANTLHSFANIAGPMTQAALILGAKKIGFIGIDMKWPEDGPSHHYGDGEKVGAYKFAHVRHTMLRFKMLKAQTNAQMFNLSPITGTPFSAVFGNTSLKDFLRDCEGCNE